MKKIAFAALTALGLSAASTQASTITIDYQVSGNPFGSDNFYMPVRVDSDGYDGTVHAGQFAMTNDTLGDFIAFCFELSQTLRDGRSYDYAPTVLSESVRDNVDRLFSSAYELVTDGLTAAGFQVALWEVVEDTSTGFDLASGSFSARDVRSSSGSVVNTAQGFLDGLSGAPMGLYEIDYLVSSRSQDLITAQPVPTPVPLPAGGLLLISGFAGIAGLKRLKKRAA